MALEELAVVRRLQEIEEPSERRGELAGRRGVAGPGRSRSGAVWGRRQPEVGEDRAHDAGVGHGGDEAQAGPSLSLAAALVRDGVGSRPGQQNRIGRESDAVRKVGGVEHQLALVSCA